MTSKVNVNATGLGFILVCLLSIVLLWAFTKPTRAQNEINTVMPFSSVECELDAGVVNERIRVAIAQSRNVEVAADKRRGEFCVWVYYTVSVVPTPSPNPSVSPERKEVINK